MMTWLHGGNDEEQYLFAVQCTVKFLNFSDSRKLYCNLPKIQEKRPNLGYFVKKMQNE